VTRTGRRATWAAHGDYLFTTYQSSHRHVPRARAHRRARVAPATATRRTIGHVRDDDSHVDIPILPADVDLSCLRHIDVNRHVRSIARHLRMQDLPDSYGLMSELLQSAVVGVDLHAADPTSERGALGLYLMDLAPAYIFRRPPDVEPYSKPELRRRAAAVVDSLVDGTFHLRWLDFIRPALQLNATADDDLAMEEAAEPGSRHRRGRIGALRGRHTATTYQSSRRHVPRARHGTAGRA
jgi:hypothetical protein